LLRCIYCGFCEDACPTEAIVLEHEYELAYSNRAAAIFTKDQLLVKVPEGGSPTPQMTEAGLYTRSVPEMQDPED
jgi:NADH-quinone oxidoreductase subunit I